MQLRTFMVTLFVLLHFPRCSLAEFTGTWEQEWAIQTSSSQPESQKFESIIEPEWRARWGDISTTARIRLRLDSDGGLGPKSNNAQNYSSLNGPWYNEQKGEISLRELYMDSYFSVGKSNTEFSWRIGKQQVVWGQADGLKVLDMVNPQSYREFILDNFEDSRIPLWMINLSVPIGNSGTLQLLWIPDTTYHELAEPGSVFQITSPLRVPHPNISGLEAVHILDVDKPNHALNDSDAGIKYAVFWQGWDLTLNYFYHYQDFPVLYQQRKNDTVTITPTYKRNHLLGGSASNTFGDFILRAEAGYNSDSYFISSNLDSQGVSHYHEIASVLGLDWQGLSDTLLSVQWFQSYLLNYHRSTVRDQSDQSISFLARRLFQNETWKAQLMILHSLNDEDGLVRPRISHTLLSQLDIWIAADVFYGDSHGLYGEFDANDRLTVGFELGF